jgi:hypothetical protein
VKRGSWGGVIITVLQICRYLYRTGKYSPQGGALKVGRGTTNDTGQLNGYDRGNSSAAAQLASSLGIPGLSRLTEQEAERVMDYFNEAFDEGWRQALDYTDDMARLTSAPDATEH